MKKDKRFQLRNPVLYSKEYEGIDSVVDDLLIDEKPSLEALESKRVANKVKQKYGNAIRKLGSI